VALDAQQIDEGDTLMRKTSQKTAFADIPPDYAALVAMYPPRPIHDSVDYANTVDIVMAMAGHKLTRDQDDYLTILSEMILHYDREHDEPRKRGTPHERLQYLVKEAGLSASDLGRLLGNRTMGSLFLTGKRGLSKANIRKLAGHFKVRADYFL
jgi:HTH-type transcriptional regulator/antitoxin HigA